MELSCISTRATNPHPSLERCLQLPPEPTQTSLNSPALIRQTNCRPRRRIQAQRNSTNARSLKDSCGGSLLPAPELTQRVSAQATVSTHSCQQTLLLILLTPPRTPAKASGISRVESAFQLSHKPQSSFFGGTFLRLYKLPRSPGSTQLLVAPAGLFQKRALPGFQAAFLSCNSETSSVRINRHKLIHSRVQHQNRRRNEVILDHSPLAWRKD